MWPVGEVLARVRSSTQFTPEGHELSQREPLRALQEWMQGTEAEEDKMNQQVGAGAQEGLAQRGGMGSERGNCQSW